MQTFRNFVEANNNTGKQFTATFEQIRSWPTWHDPETGLRAKVGTRKGPDYPITAGDNFFA